MNMERACVPSAGTLTPAEGAENEVTALDKYVLSAPARKGADSRRVAAASEQAAAAVARVLHAADADGPAAHSSRCSSF